MIVLWTDCHVSFGFVFCCRQWQSVSRAQPGITLTWWTVTSSWYRTSFTIFVRSIGRWTILTYGCWWRGTTSGMSLTLKIRNPMSTEAGVAPWSIMYWPPIWWRDGKCRWIINLHNNLRCPWWDSHQSDGLNKRSVHPSMIIEAFFYEGLSTAVFVMNAWS